MTDDANKLTVRTEWNPTREEMQAYRGREIELCRREIRKDPLLKQNQTIFSQATFAAASFLENKQAL